MHRTIEMNNNFECHWLFKRLQCRRCSIAIVFTPESKQHFPCARICMHLLLLLLQTATFSAFICTFIYLFCSVSTKSKAFNNDDGNVKRKLTPPLRCPSVEWKDLYRSWNWKKKWRARKHNEKMNRKYLKISSESTRGSKIDDQEACKISISSIKHS